MPAPSPFPLAGQLHPGQQAHPGQPFYPALHLYPLNDSFIPKQISLAPQNGRVKIGRQTNAKTVPGERNGYFDSKVLSRQHAEVWEEGGKIYIKDVKSSNGTFINGERLSPEGVESEPFELKSEDTVEFGIDIVGEDNKTIIHHKVAAKIFCVLTPDDLRALQMHPPMPPSHHNAFNNRRAGMQAQMQTNSLQNNALGGMGAPRGGKSGLTFDHILSRLQNELQKSRDTAAELNGISGVMNEVNDVLGGNVPPTLPSYPAILPPVRAPVEHPPPQATDSASPTNGAALTTIQTQLHDTQAALAAQIDKMRHLESYMAEQEAVRREVGMIKEQMEERRREVEIILAQRRTEEDPGSRFNRRREEDSIAVVEDEDDDDDARSVSTVTPEERESDEEGDDERRRRREELGRPRTPEPTGHGLYDEFEDEHKATNGSSSASSTLKVPSSEPSHATNGSTSADSHLSALAEIHNQNSLLNSRIEILSQQLDSAMEISKKLESQAAMAHETIATLHNKIGTLEAFVQDQKAHQEAAAASHEDSAKEDGAEADSTPGSGPSSAPEAPAPVEPSVGQSIWQEWRERVEGDWKSEREGWVAERTRLADAVKEWEQRTADLERKEQERQEKEESEQRKREALGFYDSDDEDAGDVFSKPNGATNGHPIMNGNGHGPRRGKSNRRRRLSMNSNGGHGLANGTLLPSPLASPTSSTSSSYPNHVNSSPPHLHQSHMNGINGKLPISPPNTSPRSRAESLRPLEPSESDAGAVAEEGEEKGALGFMNGGVVASPTTASPTTALRKPYVGDIVSNCSLISAVAFALAALLLVWSVADVVSLVLPLPSYARDSSTLFIHDLLAPFNFTWTFPGDLAFVTDSFNSMLDTTSSVSSIAAAAPSSFLFSTHDASAWKLFQPLPFISAAGVVVLGIAAWAVANRAKV